MEGLWFYMEKLRIYIAGPYTPVGSTPHKAVQKAAHNVDKAINAAIEIIKKGHYPFVPHLSHYIHTNPKCDEDFGEYYYELDNTFLKYWANALLYLESSKGADQELKYVKKLDHKLLISKSVRISLVVAS